MNEAQIQTWIHAHEETIEPLERELGLAHWNLATTGKKEFEEQVGRLRARYRKIYANREEFLQISQWHQERNAVSPLLRRQVEVLWQQYAQNQFAPALIEEISRLESEVEGIYNNFRGEMDGTKVDSNRIRKILRDETNSNVRQKAWLASKQIGPEVEPLVLKLVGLRNEGARACGFKDYYAMSLALEELSQEKLFSLLDTLADQTQKPFVEAKMAMDREQGERFGVAMQDLRPWHYADPFFQEAPPRKGLQLDFAFENQDIVELTRKTFAGMGLEIDGIIERSDLFPREGKDQHAFCTMIGRSKEAPDVRVLCNIEKTDYWMSTMLHEFGHAVYDAYLGPNLPHVLFSPAHILSTEAIAMYFGRLTRDPDWLATVLGLGPAQIRPLVAETRKQLALGMLIFVRWILVMCHFERALYENPKQDLNRLWWTLVEKYQGIRCDSKRNEPDWVTKNHIALAPVYYQNYLLGELIASQLEHFISVELLQGQRRIHNPAVGKFLKRFFAHGSSLRWDEHLLETTKERLNPAYFVEQFVSGR